MGARSRFGKSALAGLLACGSLLGAVPARASDTPDPTSVAIIGDLQSELGCASDFDASCPETTLERDQFDGIWRATLAVPAGSWQYKIALNGGFDENYGGGATRSGPNIPITLGSTTDVTFYYDHETHWVTDNVTSRIATAVGSFQSALGCPGDFDAGCLRSWLEDVDGDGIYTFTTSALPAGTYEFKVAIGEGFDEIYGADAGPDNLSFTVAAGDTVTISFDGATNVPTVTVVSSDTEPPTWSVPSGVTVLATGVSGTSVTYAAEATDDVGVTSSSCNPASGSAFPIGATTVTCTATDAAGNVGMASFDITVNVDRTSLGVLLQAIQDAGLNIRTERILVAPVKLADRLLSDSKPRNDRLACVALTTFELELHLLEGRSIDTTAAVQLSDFATAIITALGCAPPSGAG